MKTLMLALLALTQEADRRVAVTLTDGSTLVTSTGVEVLQFRTPYGDQRIPLGDIGVARRLPHGAFVVSARNLNVRGDLTAKEFELTTAIGPLRVATEDIQAIGPLSGARGMTDAGTAALWWFPTTEGNACRDQVKGRALTLEDFEVVADAAAGTKVLTRRKQQAFGTAPGDEETDLAEGDYTVEVRFKAPAAIRQYLVVLQKGNAADGSVEFQITAATNLTLNVYCGRTGNSIQTPQPVLKQGGWNSVALVKRNASSVVYVNGKQAAVAPFAIPFGSGRRTAINVGAPLRLANGGDAPESLHYLRLSRVARSEEEIAELERSWETGAALAGSSRGIALRDGTFLRGECAGLSGSVFRTAYGALTLSDQAGAQLQLYRLRPKELAQVQADARRLVPELGAGRIEERNAATERLIALGEAAVAVLHELRDASDPEVRNRIAAILKKHQESGVARNPACDVLRFGGSSIHGWIDAELVEISTRRGSYRIPASQIDRIGLGRRESRGGPVLTLKSGEKLEFRPVDGAAVDVETSFGSLKLPLAELRGLKFNAEKQCWTVAGERLSATGRVSGSAGLETSLGILTLPMAESRELQVSDRLQSPAPTDD